MSDSVPSYRLHKATGQAVVTLNGRDYYLGTHASPESRAEYDRLVAEWLAHGRRLPTAQEMGGLSLVEFFLAYLHFAREYYSRDGVPTQEFRDMGVVIDNVKLLYGRSSVGDFGPLCLKAVRQVWIDRGYARKRINQMVNRVRRIFKWGVENELVPPGVLHALQAIAPLKRGRTTARESKPVRPVPEEHVRAILSFVSRQVAAMIQLQELTGMRPGEVVLMRPVDVDRSNDIWEYCPIRHKTEHHEHTRRIFLGPQAQDILRPFLDRPPELYCFSPAEAEAERNALRRQRRSSPMTPSQRKRRPKSNPQRAKRDSYDRDSYRRAIEYAIGKAGVPHWHPHQLRHNCGTRVRRDFGLDAAQIVLGHRTADVTEVYAEADRTKALQVIRQIG